MTPAFVLLLYLYSLIHMAGGDCWVEQPEVHVSALLCVPCHGPRSAVGPEEDVEVVEVPSEWLERDGTAYGAWKDLANDCD